jgi:hypothetical protein
VALGLPGTRVTMVLGLMCIVPVHRGHSLVAGMVFVL